MEAAESSEMFLRFYQTTRRHISEGSNLYETAVIISIRTVKLCCYKEPQGVRIRIPTSGSAMLAHRLDGCGFEPADSKFRDNFRFPS
jgi:hypothetical protein